MKKYVRYVIILFLISVGIGLILSKVQRDDIAAQNISGDTSEVGSPEEKAVQTSADEVKITPDTKIMIETKYQDCKHTETKEYEAPNELINFTESDLKEKFPDWIIKNFSEDEVDLYALEEGLCSEHFKVTIDENNMLAIYQINSEYDTNLYEETDISAEYLTKDDLKKLEEGIYVYGEADLNSVIESFE